MQNRKDAPTPTYDDTEWIIARLPAASQVLDTLRLVNAQFSAKWPDPSADIVTDRSAPT